VLLAKQYVTDNDVVTDDCVAVSVNTAHQSLEVNLATLAAAADGILSGCCL